MRFVDRLLEVASCGSRLYNVWRGGSSDISFSARCYRDQLPDLAFVDRVLGRGHCERWWRIEVARCRETLALAEAMERGVAPAVPAAHPAEVA